MTLPAAGQIAASLINVELGRASTAPFSINGAQERALAGVPTGQITFDNFHGKSATFSVSAAPSLIDQTASTGTITTAVSGVVTISGGVGPFTYSWSLSNQLGDAPVSVVAAASASTQFRATLPFSGNTASADAQCVVTDTFNAQTRTTNIISIDITRT